MTRVRSWLKGNAAEVALVVSVVQTGAAAVIFLAASQGYVFATPSHRTRSLEASRDSLADQRLPARLTTLEALADSSRRDRLDMHGQLGTLERRLDDLARYNCYKDPSTATLAGLPCQRLLSGVTGGRS